MSSWPQGGDLCRAITEDSKGQLKWYGRGCSIALDVARGLSFLHNCRVSINAGSTLHAHTGRCCLLTLQSRMRFQLDAGPCQSALLCMWDSKAPLQGVWRCMRCQGSLRQRHRTCHCSGHVCEGKTPPDLITERARPVCAQCMHGDLTTRNILLDASRTAAKIGDLGLTRRLHAAVTEASLGGTLAFAAPEVLLNMSCNEQVRKGFCSLQTGRCCTGKQVRACGSGGCALPVLACRRVA